MQEDVAWPRTRLRKLWREWINLHTVLDKGMPGRMAAPFFSAASPQICTDPILVVGKATGGNWWLDEYKKLRKSPDEAIRNRLSRNRKFVREGGNGSAFWKLFERLTILLPEPDSRSLIWSNVAKIGCLKDNPEGILLSAQKDLAERTLRMEIEEYRPVLVVFVTGSYAGDVINHALGLRDGEWQHSSKSDPDEGLWWREGAPALLWTRHPQGVAATKIAFWLKRARALTCAKGGSSE